MKDKFENFVQKLTDKTTAGNVPWKELEQGVYNLQLKNHYIKLTFHVTLLKKPEFPLKFEVLTNDGRLILQLIQAVADRFQSVPDRYYHRLHALCRAVRGETLSIDDTVDLLEKEMTF